MCKANILRNVIAIVICLAAMTFSAQAQLGGAIKNAANTAKKEVKKEVRQEAGQKASNAPEAVTQAAEAAGVEASSSSIVSQARQPDNNKVRRAAVFAKSNKAMSWEEAVKFCQEKGGRLPIIGGTEMLVSNGEMPVGIMVEGLKAPIGDEYSKATQLHNNGDCEKYWTGTEAIFPNGSKGAWYVGNGGNLVAYATSTTAEYICAVCVRSKEEIYPLMFGFIEQAKKDTEYVEKNENYSKVHVSRGVYVYSGVLSCDDAELPMIDKDMLELEVQLNDMYDALVKQGKKPEHSPAKYEPCDKILSDKAAFEKRKQEEAQRGIQMPKSYKIDGLDENKVFEAAKSKMNSDETLMKVLYLSEDWYVTRQWRNNVLEQYRQVNIGVIVKKGEEYWINYWSAIQDYNHDGTYRNAYRFGISTIRSQKIDYKP